MSPIALLLSFVPLLAVQEPGERLPEVRVKSLAQTPARSFDEFTGRVVLLEFFAHWCAPCARSVKHLNELEETFGARGFSVVAVTGDRPRDAEPWIEKTGARYAWGYDDDGKLQQLFDLRKTGIPFSVLIDPFGTIVWTGNPMSLKEATVERALAAALEPPVWSWPEEARALAPQLARGELEAAFEAATRLPREADFARQRIDQRAQAMGAHFERLIAREDYEDAFRFAERIAQECRSFPVAESVAARVGTLRADPEVQRGLELERRLGALEARAAEVRSVAEGRAYRAEIERLVADSAGKKQERRARRLLEAVDRALAGQAEKR